jgi:hypothetical protein
MADAIDTTAARQTRAIHMLVTLDGYEGSELADSRKSAWDYYLQKPRGDEVEGRSPVVSGDVSAMIESTLAQVTEAFATDRLAEFEGDNAADEFQAQLEGAVVSRMVMSGKGWFRVASAVKNALLLRMGVMKGQVIDCTSTTVVTLGNIGPIAYAGLKLAGKKVVDWDRKKRTAKVEREEQYQQLDFTNVNAENFLFMQWPLDDFENIPACAERFVWTRQQLIDEEGVPEKAVDELTSTVQPWKSDDAAHRQRTAVIQTLAISPRQQLVEWFALYYLFDGKRYRAVCCNNKVLKEEVVSKRPPYAIGVPFINPGRLDGFSVYDKVRSTQDQGTALTRMLNDNANAVTMNRLAVIEGAANNDQLTDQDPTGVLQIRKSYAMGDIRNAVMPIQVLDLSAGLIAALNYNRGVRAEMGGASLEVGTGQVQLPDRMGSMGLDRAYSASEQLSSLVLKTFSQTLITDLWLLGHELLRTEWVGELPVKINGRWETPTPSEWPKRRSVMVKPGMSPGERARRSTALGGLIGLQEKLAAAGMEGVLVDAERYYRSVCDWARLNDIASPEQYLIDPTSDAAKSEMQSKAQQAQAQQAAAANLQKMAVALEQMGVAVQKYGIDVKAAVDKYKADLQADTEEAKLTVGLVDKREERDLKLAAPKEPKTDDKGEDADDKPDTDDKSAAA